MATQWLRRALAGWRPAHRSCCSPPAAAAAIESHSNPHRARRVRRRHGRPRPERAAALHGQRRQHQQLDAVVVANAFGHDLAPARSGGTSYATGNARVAAKPGRRRQRGHAHGGASRSTPSWPATTSAPSDLVLVNAGTRTSSSRRSAAMDGAARRAEQTLDAVGAAGTRAGPAGAPPGGRRRRHVVVVGPYNLGRSPWAKQTNARGPAGGAQHASSTTQLVAIVDLGDNVLYVRLRRCTSTWSPVRSQSGQLRLRQRGQRRVPALASTPARASAPAPARSTRRCAPPPPWCRT